jgi:hypothetical protein
VIWIKFGLNNMKFLLINLHLKASGDDISRNIREIEAIMLQRLIQSLLSKGEAGEGEGTTIREGQGKKNFSSSSFVVPNHSSLPTFLLYFLPLLAFLLLPSLS